MYFFKYNKYSTTLQKLYYKLYNFILTIYKSGYKDYKEAAITHSI